MDLLAIILACSLHPDDALVRTLVDVQSGGAALFVGDLSTLNMNDGLLTTADALGSVEKIRLRGGRPAVGLLGIPTAWAARHGLREVDLFDSCTNIAVGTAALSEYHDRCTGKAWRRSKTTGARSRRRSPDHSAMRSARTCILASFATDLGLRGTPAVILKALAKSIRDRQGHGGAASPEESAIFGSEAPGRTESRRWIDPSEGSATTSDSAKR